MTLFVNRFIIRYGAMARFNQFTNALYFLITYFLVSLLYGTLIIILYEYTGYGFCDELLLLLIPPVYYASFYYRRFVYITSILIILSVSIWVLSLVVSQFQNSVATLLLMMLTIAIAAEMIYHMQQERYRISKQLQIHAQVLENMMEGVSLVNEEGTILYTNPAMNAMFDYDTGELIGQDVTTLNTYPPEENQRFISQLFAQLHREGCWYGEIQNRRKNGSPFITYTQVSRLDISGEIHWVSVQEDITERKRTEEALRDSEERYRLLVEYSPDAIIVHSDQKIMFANSAALQLFGGERMDELLNQDIYTFLHPEHHQLVEERIQQILENGHSYSPMELRMYHKNGEIVDVEITGVRIQYQGQPAIQTNLRDISKRKQVEQQMAVMARFPSENPNPVMRISHDGVLLYANKASQPLLEMWGITINESLPPDWKTIITNVLQSRQYLDVRLNCGEYTFLLGITPIEDSDTINLYGKDITEMSNLEEQLRQSQKLEAIGKLAGGIAHDFNNILTGILGNLSLLQEKSSPELQRYVSAARTAAARAAKLVEQMLNFSRKSKIPFSRENINLLVQEVYHLLRETIDRRIHIHLNLQENLPDISINAPQIQSVIMNLCINSRDAIQDILDGKCYPERQNDHFVISMNTELHTIGISSCLANPPHSPGEYLVLRVSDNGTGMDEDIQQHLFEPFFTTREVGKGTGLGLASSYGIIQQHHGCIQFHTEPGAGSTFSVYLPVNRNLSESDSEIQPPFPDSTRGGETILIVDDEEIICSLIQDVLESSGYQVLIAEHGAIGLELLKQKSAEIDAVILDYSMPVLSGREFLEKIQEMAIRTRVILCSGYLEQHVLQALQFTNLKGFLKKPYHPHELLEKVRHILDDVPDSSLAGQVENI
jgi:two-component system cell cycle sensor histidine kinase/response regulator CckA